MKIVGIELNYSPFARHKRRKTKIKNDRSIGIGEIYTIESASL
jgi:hypothetical protein